MSRIYIATNIANINGYIMKYYLDMIILYFLSCYSLAI